MPGRIAALSQLMLQDKIAAALPDTITVDGTTVKAILRIEGRHASASGWDFKIGGPATLIGTGTAPTYHVAGPGPRDLSERCDTVGGSKCFQAGSAAVGEITTEDFIIESAFHIGSSTPATGTFWQKRVGGSGPGGWAAVLLSTREFYVQLYPGAIAAFQSAALSLNSDNHYIGFARRLTSAQAYIAGARSAGAFSISAASASLTSSYVLTAQGNDGSGTNGLPGGIYVMQLFLHPGLSTHLQDAVAAARFALVDPYI